MLLVWRSHIFPYCKTLLRLHACTVISLTLYIYIIHSQSLQQDAACPSAEWAGITPSKCWEENAPRPSYVTLSSRGFLDLELRGECKVVRHLHDIILIIHVNVQSLTCTTLYLSNKTQTRRSRIRRIQNHHLRQTRSPIPHLRILPPTRRRWSETSRPHLRSYRRQSPSSQ